MVNRRFLELAERLRNDSAPARKKFRATNGKSDPARFTNPTGDPFILQYDSFGNELIAKSNQVYSGTAAEIDTGDSGEVKQMNILKRAALLTTLSKDATLRSYGFWPITPIQSERYLKTGKLVTPEDNWEDLALILYDASDEGENPNEAKALSESIRAHAKDLGLNKRDLEQRLIVVNPGLKVDLRGNGVVPIVLPGITQVYTHEVLAKAGEGEFTFKGYGLTRGLPKTTQLNKNGDRTLYLPDEDENIGLRVLVRNGDLYLVAGCRNLAVGCADGRVQFAPQGMRKK